MIVAAFCLLGSALCIAFLRWLCRPPTFRELMRFPGNEEAARLYEQRRDAFGHGARLKESQ